MQKAQQKESCSEHEKDNACHEFSSSDFSESALSSDSGSISDVSSDVSVIDVSRTDDGYHSRRKLMIDHFAYMYEKRTVNWTVTNQTPAHLSNGMETKK